MPFHNRSTGLNWAGEMPELEIGRNSVARSFSNFVTSSHPHIFNVAAKWPTGGGETPVGEGGRISVTLTMSSGDRIRMERRVARLAPLTVRFATVPLANERRAMATPSYPPKW